MISASYKFSLKWSGVREKLLRIKANPKKISLGYALGVFLGTTPFIGTKVFVALILTSLMKWNRTSSVIGVYHINILTAPLFYGAAFFVGRMLVGAEASFTFPDTFSLQAMYDVFFGNSSVFLSLFVGGLVLGIPMAAGAYFLSITILRNSAFQGPSPLPQIRHPESTIQYPTSDISHPASSPVLPSPPLFTLITGASSGLGREMAIECAAQGRNLILVALPGRNMDVLCRSLERQFGIRALFFERDLTSSDEIHELVHEILPKYRVNFLINNAGTGGTLPFGESSTEYLNRIIQLNITALSLLTRLLLSELQRHEESWILNVSSMAAFGPMPFKTVYPASKAFVAHFSRSLGEELKETSVKVAVLHPGPILTNPDVVIRIIRQGANGRRGLLSGRELARRAISGLEKGKRTIVPGFSNKLNRFLMTAIPDEFLVPFLARVVQKEIHGVRRAA